MLRDVIAFRQVAADFGRSPTFASVFGGTVVVDRRLNLGWLTPPGFWCLFRVGARACTRQHNIS